MHKIQRQAMISFIMMAYNVESYIEEAIAELQKEQTVEWELIIVEDFSDDDTFEVAKNIADQDDRITLVKNISKGKVAGTNLGYSLTKGDIIKCIDSDDVLQKDFFEEYKTMKNYDAHCHDALIVSHTLEKMGVYTVNPAILDCSYEDVVNNLISLPKAYWSFKREIADKIFPMPENLPFEDVWISLHIKKYAKSIYHITKPVYLYRQHENQVFGGILNYDSDRVVFRANRLIKLINIIENEQKYLIEDINEPFVKMKLYLDLQTRQGSIVEIISTKIDLKSKIKLMLILHFPSLAISATKLKWRLDNR